MKKLNNLIVHCASSIVHQSKTLTLLLVMLMSVNMAWGEVATLNSVSSKLVADATTTSVSMTFDGVTCTVSRDGGVNNPGFYTSSGIVRYYSNDVMTLSVPSGSTISQIEFDMTSGTVGTASPTGLSTDSKKWTGSANSVSFKGGGTVKISSIVVTYSASGPVTQYDLTYHVGSASTTIQVNSGTKLTTALKDVTTTSCDETSTTFMGWSESAITGKVSKDDVTLLDADATVTDGMEVWAVWAKKTTGTTQNKTSTFSFKSAPGSPWKDSNTNVTWTYSNLTFDSGNSSGMKSTSATLTATLPTDAVASTISYTGSGNTWADDAAMSLKAKGISTQLTSLTKNTKSYTFTNANKNAGEYTLTCTKTNCWIASVAIKYSITPIDYSDYLTTCAPTYAITTNNPANGSIKFSTDGTNWSNSIADQQEDADVFFKLVPNAGYEIGGTPTLSTGGDVTDLGEGVYGFTMPAAPVTVSATFVQPAKYIILYDKGNWESAEGDVPDPDEVTPGTNYTINSTDKLSLTGYTFRGWNTDKNASVGLTNITVNDDITLYAIFTINSYNVTFTPSITGGSIKVNGSSTSPVSVQYNSDVTITVNPTSKYFKLTTLTYNSTDIKDAKQFTMPAEDVAVEYAFTEDEKVTVTFSNNGEPIDGFSRQVYAGDGIGKVLGVETPLPTLTSTDAKDARSKTFVGWTEDKVEVWQPNKPTLVDASTIINEAKTYNAVWAKGDGKYQQITSESKLIAGNKYVIQNDSKVIAHNSTPALIQNEVALTEVDGKLTPEARHLWTLAGSVDDGWSFVVDDTHKLSTQGSGTDLTLTGNNILWTIWNIGETQSSRETPQYNTDDYFWIFQSDDSKDYYIEYSSSKWITYGISNTKWPSTGQNDYFKIKLYTSSLTDYITHSSSSPLASITLNTDKVKKNYFVGESFTSANLTATAKLEDGITFSIEYNDLDITPADLSTDGTKEVTVSYTFNNATKSETYDVNAYSVTIDKEMEHQVDGDNVDGNIAEWNVATKKVTVGKANKYYFDDLVVDGATSTGSFATGYTLSDPDKNVTVTAKWHRLFTLQYEENGGSTVSDDVDKPYNTAATLPTTSKTGYNFVGWFDNEQLSGEALTSYAITADAKLYAKWSEIMPASISLIPDVTEITDLIYDDSNKNTKKITATVEPSTALYKTFAWSVVEGDDVVKVDADGTITAKAAGTAKVKVASTRDANVYKEISVTVHALPQITWMNMDGTTFFSSTGTSAGKVGKMPTDTPESCDTEKYPYFRGWSATDFGKTTENPEANFVTKDTEVALDGEYTFYAVCAAGEEGDEPLTVFSEDFASITEGNSTSSTGSGSDWNGNSNFNTNSTGWNHVYKAGGAVRIGKTGKLTTKNLDLSAGEVVVSFKVKGWSNSENSVSVQVGSQTSQSVSSTSYMNTGDFEQKSLTFNADGENTAVKFTTTGNIRVFLDDIVITCGKDITYTTWATQCCTPWTPSLSYASSTMQVTDEQDAVVGTTHGTATYTSSNSSAITVDENTGKITAVGGGTATISVTWTGDDTYCEQSTTSQEITVNGSLQVTFNGNGADGGTAMEPQMVEYGVATNLNKNTYTKTGYSFEGWAETSDATSIKYTDEQNVTLTAGVELFAVWSINAYKVTIQDVTGGTIAIEPKTTTIDYNKTVTATATLASGYNFGSWSATPAVTFADATNKSTTFSMPDNNVTLTASYTPILVTKIDLKKGSDVVTALEFEKNVTNPVTLTTAFTPADALVKTVNWQSDNEAVATVVDGVITAKGLGTAVVTATSTVVPSVAGSVTVTVYEWQDADPKYTLTNQPASMVYYETNKIDFANWTIKHNYKRSDDAAKTKQEDVASSNWTVTLGGAAISNNYTLTTADNGKALVIKVGETELYNQTLTVNAKAKHTYIDRVHGNEDKVMMDTYTIPSLSNTTAKTEGTCNETHYVFKGWVAEANADAPTDDNLIAAGGSATAEADATFYAVWAERRNVTEDKTLKYGWESTDSKTGWTINGSTSPSAHTGSKSGSVTGSGDLGWVNCIATTTAIAKPKSIICYYSKDNNNNNSSSYWAIEIKTSAAGNWQVIQEGNTYNKVTKYQWYELSADLTSYTNIIVGVNAKTTASDRLIDDVVLTYEVTEPKDVDYITECVTRYELTFDANGGTGTAPTAIMLKEGGKVALPDADLTKAYNDFSGWNTATDGKGTHYDVTDEYTMGDAAAVLYADWAPRAVTALEITSNATATEFGIGQTFNADGLKVKATYEGGETESNVEFTTNFDGHVFTEQETGTQTVKVSYKGFSADLYTVTVAPALIVRFYVNGQMIQEKPVFDQKIGTMPNAMTTWKTFTDNEARPDLFPVFAGWIIGNNLTANPTFVSDATEIEGDVNVHAVFAHDYTIDQIGTTAVGAADLNPAKRYVIGVTANDETKYYQGTTDDSNWANMGELESAEIVSILGKGMAYTIQQTNGKYIEKKLNDRPFLLVDDAVYTITITDDKFIKYGDGEYYLSRNTGSGVSNTGLRWYGTGDNYPKAFLYEADVTYDQLTLIPYGQVIRNDVKSGTISGVCYERDIVGHSGAKFYYLSQKAPDESYIELTEVTGVLHAGYPYLFEASSNEIRVIFDGEEVQDGPYMYNGLYGTFINQELGDGFCIILNNKYYRTHTGNNNGCYAHRAYLKLDEVSYDQIKVAPGEEEPATAPRRIRLGGDGVNTPTGFDDILNVNAELIQKLIINDKMYILRAGKMYDATGKFVK